MEHMTKEQVRKLKQQILGLHWDSNVKRAKAHNLTALIPEKQRRFTRTDYKDFFKSRRIAPKFPCR